jgi:hypothetical protein
MAQPVRHPEQRGGAGDVDSDGKVAAHLLAR